MSSEGVRTHVMLPRDVVEGVDQLVGHRGRSRFVAEAVAEKVQRERQTAALNEAIGSIDIADYPEWSTPEKVSEWVHRMRREDDEISERSLRRGRHDGTVPS